MKLRRKTLTAFAAGTALLGTLGWSLPVFAADTGPIKIGVIGEESAVAGASITKAAQLAADDINKAGGVDGRKIQIITYDDHSSATDAVRAFQRAVKQDHVVAVVASYISEVALAIEPWAARLHTPFITPGAASTLISKNVHDNYDKNKYTFHGYVNSAFLADAICAFSKDELVGKFHMKSTAIMSEDAAWTTPLDEEFAKCLPKAGLKVVDHIRFNPDTTDFTPIFNK
ncbi:MAG TPA: ABC transporter substrate-binding protein, partial [Rhizobiaceae bacterium]|nr:ABC transporter substrate-binding protein [Rhizobiaceae bacterium]